MILVLIIVCILSTTISSSSSSSSSSELIHSKTLPQAIIIGVKKCGTRALLKFLSTHPAIAASPTEIHYFDSSKNFQFGLDWYRYVNKYLIISFLIRYSKLLVETTDRLKS